MSDKEENKEEKNNGKNKENDSKTENDIKEIIENQEDETKNQEMNLNLHQNENQQKIIYEEQTLIEGEVEITLIDKIIYIFPQDQDEKKQHFYGVLRLTNYRLYFIPTELDSIKFIPSQNFPEITLGNIASIEKFGGIKSKNILGFGFEILHKEFKKTKFYIPYKRIISKNFIESLEQLITPTKIQDTFAFSHKKQKDIDDGWQIYNPIEEFKRFEIPNDSWRISQYNDEYKLSETYPSHLIIPNDLKDEELTNIASSRFLNRIPVLVWKNNSDTVFLLRGAQSKQEKKTASYDEKYIKEIIELTKNKGDFIIIDCQNKKNTSKNKNKNKNKNNKKELTKIESDYGCKIEFLGISAKKVIEESINKLRNLCLFSSNLFKLSNENKKWYSSLEETNWINHLKTIISSSIQIGNYLNNNTSVLIQSANGRDRSVTSDTPILCRLEGDSNVFIRRIEELYNNQNEWVLNSRIKNKETCFPLNNLEVWTEDGFVKVYQIVRHKTCEEIVRVVTDSGSVDVTKGHSLLDLNGNCVKIDNVDLGHPILHHKFSSYHQKNTNSSLKISDNLNALFVNNQIAWSFGFFAAFSQCESGNNWKITHFDHNLILKFKSIFENIFINLKDKNQNIKMSKNSNQSIFKITFNIENINNRKYELSLNNPFSSNQKTLSEQFNKFLCNQFFHFSGERKIPDFVLNWNSQFQKSFFDGLVGNNLSKPKKLQNQKIKINSKSKLYISGIYLLVEEIGEMNIKIEFNEKSEEFEIEVSKKKETERNQKKPNLSSCVKQKIKIGVSNQYVYDLSTRNEHFQAGIGNIIVHNTAQLSSLTQLLEDHFYRTIRGFEILIEKEWISFGHDFGIFRNFSKKKNNEKPSYSIFIQWIDCVYQVLHQFPNAFEFNEDLLINILENLFSLKFGTFIFPFEKDRKENNIHLNTYSLWTSINENLDLFVNPMYQPVKEPLRPSVFTRHIAFWERYYMKSLFSQKIQEETKTIQRILQECSKLSQEMSLFEKENIKALEYQNRLLKELEELKKQQNDETPLNFSKNENENEKEKEKDKEKEKENENENENENDKENDKEKDKENDKENDNENDKEDDKEKDNENDKEDDKEDEKEKKDK
ncbi:intein-containing myotubularin-related precursor [Anaeramoeba ignava]|uniref:Intein-containing myotubularin-related n=1 Tax=Anaeramoeba ignava TaxID=1746090 RepID=A0A9Q0LCU8_ANAIG|nr:intein-containing myotubularin-related precursor [Anaeramoeba ignava]